MATVYSVDGDELGEVTVSETQQAMLDNGGTVAVLFHTPQLTRTQLGETSGTFYLRKDGDRLVTSTMAAFKQYLTLRKAIDAINKPEPTDG